ncbi:MAG: tyrosine--tRNA ligase [Ferrimicrobium sp.]|uniref:tyrosine--tRNA ligase n=1 Tax=Ferrimicrobium sp. TaxID=2926050 RepID=UPI00262043AB|nr:tyrosine--tRNA ligase [Ferrimicrobium sp.]
MTLSEDLQYRGLINQMSAEGLVERMDSAHLSLYVGFDPTADSLHLGNLLGLIMLRRFQRAGHRPIMVAGGGTGMIGDPSGRSTERTLLDDETLTKNTAAIRLQLERFVDFSGEVAGVLVDNREWLQDLNLIDYLREYGKHFSVATMLAKDSVKARLGSEGISYTEFSYMVLQAIDFLELSRRFDCTLQLGGSDQWGNITAGIDLIRRVDQREAFGLTWPLITKADGTKFGKSVGGAIWLDPHRTSPYQLYQFLVRSDDAMVMSYLKQFTFLDQEEIAELDQSHREHPERRDPHHRLASELVTLVHGQEEAERAKRASRSLFVGELELLEPDLLEEALGEAPTMNIDAIEFEKGIDLIELISRSPLFVSRSELRRTLSQGGVYLNGVAQRETITVTKDLLIDGRLLVLRRGKKDYCLVRCGAQ